MSELLRIIQTKLPTPQIPKFYHPSCVWRSPSIILC